MKSHTGLTYTKKQLAHIESGLCLDCTQQAEPNRRRCEFCAAKANERLRRWQKKKLKAVRHQKRLIQSKRLSYSTVKEREAAQGGKPR